MERRLLGRRLQQARLAIGLSQLQVADAVGIPRPAVSLIEAGQRSVTSDELARLAELYGKTADALIFEPNHERILQYFRASAPVGDAEQAVIEDALAWFKRYAEIEQVAYGEQRYDVPRYPLSIGRAIDQGEYLAEQERRRLGLGVHPIPSVIELLEHEGVKVALRAFPSCAQISGCYLFSPSLGPCVLINEGEPASRRRFTAAHEFAHVLLDRVDARGEVCTLSRRRELPEMRANSFAAALLLPPAGIEAFLGDLGVEPGGVRGEHAVRLMHHFVVSFEAVLWRLLNLDWITEEQRQSMAEDGPAALTHILGFADRQSLSEEPSPDRYRSVALDAWRSGGLSLEELADVLGLDAKHLRNTLAHAVQKQSRPARAPAAEPDWL